MHAPLTLFDRIWNEHVVKSLAPGIDLLHVDRHLMHDLGGGESLAALHRRGLSVHDSALTFATPDHIVETRPGRIGGIAKWADGLIASLRQETAAAGVRHFDLDTDGHGIVHVIGPELGLTLPGLTVVCGDSHTCTHGALGALAWGIGATEVQHVLATQTIVQRHPRSMRVLFEGSLPTGVQAKDMILALIGRIGAAGGTGCAIEFGGSAVRALGMEARMTLCNLSIEAGAKFGIIAPDDTTFQWLAGRRFAPAGQAWDEALAHWQTLAGDSDARFSAEHHINCSDLAPQMTWGTSPEHVIPIDGRIPDPAACADADRARGQAEALAYMALEPGRPLLGTPIDRVFIGSCTNSRLSDLQAAAGQIRGRRVSAHVQAWVVPGSHLVRQEAESLGLHRVFEAAGFQWRAPGCSLCVGANGELVAPGERCVSTSNRNFVGRQGPGARTHLASPVVAAECALTGVVSDPRSH